MLKNLVTAVVVLVTLAGCVVVPLGWGHRHGHGGHHGGHYDGHHGKRGGDYRH